MPNAYWKTRDTWQSLITVSCSRQGTHHVSDSVLPVELVFSVPVAWSPTDNEHMSVCVQEAMTTVDSGLDRNGMHNLFMACEPEVAMLYIVKKGLCNVQV
jgi:predicted metalloprotease